MHPGRSTDLSYTYFRQVLNAVRGHFTAHLLGNAPDILQNSDSPALFLRHDIKVSLKRAVQMAEIEHEYGLPATYMVRADSPLYSLNERNARIQLLELLQLGHEVGLHFDLTNAARQNQSFAAIVENQLRPACARIEQIICRPIRSLSLYRPIPLLLNGPMLVDGRVNADAQKLRQWLLMDIGGTWRHGDLLSRIAQPGGPVLQLLIHPLWWGQKHLPTPERLQEFFESATRDASAREAALFDINLAKAVPAARRLGIHALIGERSRV